MREVKQLALIVPYCQGARKKLIQDLDERGAAVFRSCGGPGGGGFLMAQTDPDVVMDIVAFKIALARHLGGGLRPAHGAPMQCLHSGANGRCAKQISASGGHAGSCPVGGFVIQRHDRVLRWLHRWLSQGRTSSPPLVEQVLPSEHGRLDITFVQEGIPYWIDVAITSADSECQRTLPARAQNDGRAARGEEGVKRSRYHGRAQPFVLEAHGRALQAARGLIRQFCCDCAVGAPESAAEAWSAISSVSQAGSAQIELSAYGPGAIEKGIAEIWFP